MSNRLPNDMSMSKPDYFEQPYFQEKFVHLYDSNIVQFIHVEKNKKDWGT